MATKADLEKRLKELELQHQQVQANAHAVFGALQFCRILIQEEKEPVEPLRTGPNFDDGSDYDNGDTNDFDRPFGDDLGQ